MTHKVWNASNVLGSIAFLALLFALGAWVGAIENSGPYIMPVAITAAIPILAYLSIKEDGKRK